MRFEMKKDENLSTLISYAGGFEADAYTRSLRVVRQNGQEYEVNTVKDLDYSVYKICLLYTSALTKIRLREMSNLITK